MQNSRIRRACSAVAALALLPAAQLGCGGDDPAANPRTVRSMVVEDGPDSTLSDFEMPDLDAPVEVAVAPAIVGNQAPVIRAMQVDPAPSIPGGTDVVVMADAVDPEGDDVDLEYRWFVNGQEVDFEGSRFATKELVKGDTVRVEAVASDGRSESAPMLSPVLSVVSGPPRIVSQPDAPGPDGVFRYQLEVEGVKGATGTRYSLAEAPAGMRVSPVRGLVEWTPRSDQTGVHAVEIVVESGDGAKSRQRFELTIGAVPAAPAP